MSPKSSLRLFLSALTICAALILSCGGDDDQQTAPASSGATEVVRQVLESAAPDVAPGQTLVLSRVIIPAGQSIAAHTHPGAQLAVVTSGTLTYTVLNGQVQVTRNAGSADSRSETITAGQSVDLHTGDSLIETPGMIHTAKNATDGAVIIYLSSLFPTGAPASSPAQ